jgi:hypothetical protein
VHGLLMKLESEEDWQRLREFDAGSTPSVHEVIPYHDNYCTDDDDAAVPNLAPIKAHLVEFSEHVEDQLLNAPIEQLPSDRYLNLIAQGLRQYNVDADYVEAEIMAIPYLPKRQPEGFGQLPLARKQKSLPKIKYKEYLQLCEKAQGRAIYFILQDAVFRTIDGDEAVDFEDPACRWLQRNGHGKPDCSLKFHKMLVDPDISLCNEFEEMTPLHFAWVENHVVELTQQYNFKCHQVAILRPDDTGQKSTTMSSLRSSFRAMGRRSRGKGSGQADDGECKASVGTSRRGSSKSMSIGDSDVSELYEE